VKKLLFIYRYIAHRLKAVNEHRVDSPFVFNLVTNWTCPGYCSFRVDSPFVFNLVTNVIYVKQNYYSYKKIEKLRGQLLTSNNKIRCADMGAGSAITSNKTVGSIAKHSAKSAKQAQLLFRLVNFFEPETIIELGTSLGISTAYLASANSKIPVITIEGCEEAAEIAKQNFKHLKLKNIEQLVGNFDDVFPKLVKGCKKIDLIYIDGNHRKQPTINYFQQCLAKVNEDSVLIFDDIYWSDEMMQAWHEIKNNNQVTLTIDLFYMGIVLFRKEQSKQHFMIRF
jgi:predicted O-methyltransferase YrrM